MDRVIDLVKNNKIFVIGITGGIGCGKSTIIDFMMEKEGKPSWKSKRPQGSLYLETLNTTFWG